MICDVTRFSRKREKELGLKKETCWADDDNGSVARNSLNELLLSCSRNGASGAAVDRRYDGSRESRRVAKPP